MMILKHSLVLTNRRKGNQKIDSKEAQNQSTKEEFQATHKLKATNLQVDNLSSAMLQADRKCQPLGMLARRMGWK